MTHITQRKETITSTFQSQATRMLNLQVGEALRFPLSDYWKANSTRQRAEQKQPGSKFTVRRRGQAVYVLRLS
jgi:hypothetical protein